MDEVTAKNESFTQITAQGIAPQQAKKGLIITLVAALLAFFLYLALPYAPDTNKGLALLLFVGILWLTEAVHITITALMIPVLAVLLGMPMVQGDEFLPITTKHVLSSFAHPIIFLFFGGFALATALRVQQLDKKIALWLMALSGSHLGVATAALCAVTAFLSMWVSNTATAAMMLPLAIGMLSHLDDKNDRSIFVFILLAIAYSANIGGIGTLVGSPPNAIAASALNMQFYEWIKIGLPIMLILLPVMFVVLYAALRPNLNQKIHIETQQIPFNYTRLITLVLFVVTAISWTMSKPLGSWLGITNPDTWIALSAAVLVGLFGLASWAQIAQNTDWGVLLLFGGGLTLSNVLKDSGASLVLGQEVAAAFGQAPALVMILIIAAFIIFLTEFTSNTASAALLVPVFATIAEQIGLPKEVLVMVVGIGASCAFMLPVATPPNAIVFGTGLIKQKEMVRAGVLLNITCIIVIGIYAYVFIG